MQTCRWCGRQGDWPRICMSSRDMEDKSNDPICWENLMKIGGGEYTVNRIAASENSRSH